MTPTAVSTAAAYLRRSSVSGDNPGDASREAQEAAVRRLCGQDVTVYADWGISGRSAEKRPDYMRLKDDIVAGRVTSVCAYSLSRLGRNARELLAFIELAQAHNVPVRTAVESIDTSTAMGRAMLTVMAAFAQLELEQGMERSAAAREARRERHEAAGMPVPPSRSLYGYVHITEDGLTRVERDTTPVWEGKDRIDTVLDAYREAGNVLAAAGLLNQRGVASPDGSTWDPETKRGGWGHSTLRRILDAYSKQGLVTLGRRSARNRRLGGRRSSLFAGLLRCHCGRTMTPNTGRMAAGKPLPNQYYCAGGRDNGREAHGKYTVPESRLIPRIRDEADQFVRRAHIARKVAHDVKADLEAATAQRQRLQDVYMDPKSTMTVETYRERAAALDAEIERLGAMGQGGLVALWEDRVPAWDDVEAMNRHLRRLFEYVRLDDDMNVAEVKRALPDLAFVTHEPGWEGDPSDAAR